MDWSHISFDDYHGKPLVYPKQTSRHDMYIPVDSLISDQYNYIIFPAGQKFNLEKTNKVTMIKTNIQYYYGSAGDVNKLHKQLDIIPITDLRKLIISYLTFDQIQFDVLIWKYVDVFYSDYYIVIEHYNKYYTFKDLTLRIDNSIHIPISDWDSDVHYLAKYYTLQKRIEYIKRHVVGDTDTICDVLIIFNYVYESIVKP
jgi:hypothetical protein